VEKSLIARAFSTQVGDPVVAGLAERQHGAVSTAQLRVAGLRSGAIEWRVKRGRLHRVHRGVYAVGHPRLTFRGTLWAAVLACGGVDAAALSHRTAAAVWDLATPPARPEVTTFAEHVSTSRIHVHRSHTLHPLDDVVRQPDGLPVTSVARTLVDLAADVTPHRLERMCHRAELLRRLDAREVARLLDGSRRRGAAGLRHALATLAPAEPDVTRSELEERFLALVADAGLPRPRVNATVAGYEVDFLWPRRRLIVETDGAGAHLTAAAFERDRERDAALQVAGFRVVRVTWRQVVQDGPGVAAKLGALLA
jgi:very-short-patch-repair endonuclease